MHIHNIYMRKYIINIFINVRKHLHIGVHEENFNNMIEQISIKNENTDIINTNISSLMSTYDLSKHHHHQDLSGAIERYICMYT
jgi:hypothetical protein